MTDIVERLRDYADGLSGYAADMMGEASDHIERLREDKLDALAAVESENAFYQMEIERLREALQKIADIEHEDIPAPRTPNEGTVWTVLAMVVGLAEKALKEGE